MDKKIIFFLDDEPDVEENTATLKANKSIIKT